MSKIETILRQLPQEGRDALQEHIDGETSAEWLARTITDHGYPVSATTIKAYRASRKEQNERRR